MDFIMVISVLIVLNDEKYLKMLEILPVLGSYGDPSLLHCWWTWGEEPMQMVVQMIRSSEKKNNNRK